jgi:uncharacterized protein (TIGR02145 family)
MNKLKLTNYSMENIFSNRAIFLVIVFALLSITLSDCQKEDPAALPELSTESVFNIAPTSATAGGFISSDGGETVTARGICWGTNSDPSTSDSKTFDGSGKGQFVSSLSGLTAGTTYHTRAYATNSVGTAYGTDISFTTLGQVPSCITQPATNISTTGATLNGAVNANSVSTTVTFEYGTSISYGQTITAVQSPVSGNSIANVSIDISGLPAGTTYHFRVKTVNSLGIINGGDMLFVTLSQSPVSVTDVDGNVYNAVLIGTQIWMKENLKVTKYSDGSAIPNVTDNTAWLGLTTGAYCWYNNDATNKNIYGGLYNWYAVSGSRNVCPTGWHVPNDAEWKTMEMYLGMSQSEADIIGNNRGTHNEGGKIKETGLIHWLSPNTGADNSSGFTGLGAGYRYGYIYGTFYQMNHYGCWWTFDGFNRIVFSESTVLERNNMGSQYMTYGFSVRCVKN